MANSTPKPRDDSGRISRLEGVVEALARGQETLTASLDRLHEDIRTGLDKVHDRIGKMNERSIDRNRIQWSPILAGGSMILALAAMAFSSVRSDVERLEVERHRAEQANATAHTLLDADLQREMRDLDVVAQQGLTALEDKLVNQMQSRDALLREYSDRLDQSIQTMQDDYPPEWLIKKVDDLVEWRMEHDQKIEGRDAGQTERIKALERAVYKEP
ncbi:MAG: hypothetical protein GY856_37005 [bacterium]|nr:hypothetical protein [bacterium]